MTIKRIPGLTGGHNDLANPENLNENQVQDSANYEILGDDNLTKRREPEEYGDLVSGDSLKTKLATVYTNTITQISPPYYPVKKLSDMTGDFVMLAFGQTANGYELYMFYENDTNTWTLTQVDITGVTYTEDTYLEFFVGDDNMIITDTYDETTNFPHYVKIDPEGTLITGLFSIKAPTNKPELVPTTEFNEERYEEDENNSRLSGCGIVHCVYTVITKSGDESNPSPISDAKMMQFFKKDATDRNDARWIDSVLIKNLSVPELTGDLIEELKYFNLYYRVTPYSEGEGAAPFYFSQRVEVLDKENNSGDTGNGYIINQEVDESIPISYENDIAPYAKHAAEVSGITGFGNIREKLQFPFEFEKYAAIQINNVNNKNYADAVVLIRLYDDDSGEDDYIEDLDLGYYSGYGFMTNLNKIRLYDTDLVTPLQVIYDEGSDSHLDIYVKIPLLIAGQLKTIYLAFNTDADATENGVTDTNYQTFEYGQFAQMSGANALEMFNSERVKSNATVICSSIDFLDANGDVINNADGNLNGDIQGEYGEFVEGGTKQLETQYLIGTGRYYMNDKTKRTGSDFSEIKYKGLPFDIIPNRFTLWGKISYTNINEALSELTTISSGIVPLPIFAFYQDTGHATWSEDYKGLFLGIYYDEAEETYHFALRGAEDMTGLDGAIISRYSKLIFDNIPLTAASGDLFVGLSVQKDSSASLFVGNLVSGSFYAQKKNWSDWDMAKNFDKEDAVGWYYKNIDTFSIGFNSMVAGAISDTPFRFYISQFQLIINNYYNASLDNDMAAMFNLAKYLPSFETPLGQKVTVIST